MILVKSNDFICLHFFVLLLCENSRMTIGEKERQKSFLNLFNNQIEFQSLNQISLHFNQLIKIQ